MKGTMNDDFENRSREWNEMPENHEGRPLYQSYCLHTGNVYAGEYPGSEIEEVAKMKIQQMIEFGVRHFVDLTEEGELLPYKHLLPEGTTHTRFPIRDGGIPESLDYAQRIVEHIRELAHLDGGYVYVHCWGGVGRTGTIVGCYLAEDSFEETMFRLRDCFSEMPKSAYRVVPENWRQREFIRRFVER